MKIINIFFGFILIFSPCSSMATTDSIIEELYLRALQYDDTYLSAIYELNLEKLDLGSQKAGLFPTITSSVYRTEVESETIGPQQSVTSDGRYSSEGYQVQLSQVIYDRALIEQLDSYELLIASIKNKIIDAQHDLIMRLAGAFWGVVVAEQSLLEEQKKHDLYKVTLEQAKEKNLRGLISNDELNQVASDELEQSYQKALAKFNLEMAADELFQLTLWDYTGKAGVIKSCAAIGDYNLPNGDYLSFSLHNNAQLNVLRDELKAYEKEQESKNSAYFPKVSLTADYSSSDQTGGTFDGSETDRTQVKLSLDWPIYLGGKRYGDVKKANYRLKSHQRKIELYVPKLKKKLSMIRSRLKNGAINFKKIDNAVKIRNERYEKMINQRNVGSITELDLLQERVRVEQLTTKYASACKDQILNKLEFYKLLGTLSAKNLNIDRYENEN